MFVFSTYEKVLVTAGAPDSELPPPGCVPPALCRSESVRAFDPWWRWLCMFHFSLELRMFRTNVCK